MSAAAGRKLVGLLFVLVIVLTLASVAIPVWLVQPFKPQTNRSLEISYTLRRWSPYLTAVSLFVGMLVIGWLWRGARLRVRALLIVGLLPLLVAAWFARQNHFEWMFNPLPNSAYVNASEAKHVADSDMVISVEINGEAVAYPVRLMAYHHLVHDVVGGKPIVATY
jgi:hypothetical protein